MAKQRRKAERFQQALRRQIRDLNFQLHSNDPSGTLRRQRDALLRELHQIRASFAEQEVRAEQSKSVDAFLHLLEEDEEKP